MEKGKFTGLKIKSTNINETKAGGKAKTDAVGSKKPWKPFQTAAFPLDPDEIVEAVDIQKDEIFMINEGSTVLARGKKSIPLNEYYESEMKANGIKYSDDNKVNKKDFAWVRRGNSLFISAKPNTEELPSGLYDIRSSMEQGIFLERRSVILDDLFLPPSDVMGKIVKDIRNFWTKRAKYADYGLIYKRGILTYGPPGMGKTSLFNLLISTIIEEFNGIVLNMDNINTFLAMASNIRSLEPDRPILCIIEDIDGFLQYNSVQAFLNLLDGNAACDNIVYLGSTNYINRLEPRVLRSSRFDRKYEIAPPTPETRKFYFEKKLKETDLPNVNLQKWVADTEGMAFSDMKEIIASVIVMEMPYDEVIGELKKYMEYNREEGKRY
mgnify:CR=1 FL=1